MSEHAQNQIFFHLKPPAGPQKVKWQQQCHKIHLSSAFCRDNSTGARQPGWKEAAQELRRYQNLIVMWPGKEDQQGIILGIPEADREPFIPKDLQEYLYWFFYFHQQKLSYSLFSTRKSWNSHFPPMCISKYPSVKCLRENSRKPFCFLRIILFKIIHCILSNNLLW